jgi:Spy/CpxP family protein refolding chaperone
MLKFVCAAVAAGVLAGTALAADPNNGGGQAGPGLVAPGAGGVPGNPGAWSYAKNDRILKYLGLTQEQCDKIDALWKDKNAAVQELYKGLRQNAAGANGSRQSLDPAAMKDLQEKVKALEDAFKVKLLDVLTADQKAKYEPADKAWTEYQKTLTTAYSSLDKSLSPQDRQKAVRDAQEKALATLKDELAKIFGAAFKADEFKLYGGGSSGANTR